MSKISRFFEKAQKSFVSEEDRFTIVDFEDLAEENRILACRVKHAFDRCMDVFDISYEKVLLPAALTGDSNLLDCILSFSSLPDLDIAETFVQLAASGKLHVMELIVSNKVEIEENDWGRAVVFAAQNGHSDVVRYIFSMKERISQQNLHWALNEAIKERQKEVFEILMSKTQHLQSYHLNSLCSTAISYDQVQMLSILLSDPCRLDQYYLWKLLINEAACADLPMIELIFSKLQKNDSENFKLALEQAVDHDNLPAFQFFCRNKILTQKQKEYFLVRAQQQSSHKIISFLHF
jgi:hypothetical protein